MSDFQTTGLQEMLGKGRKGLNMKSSLKTKTGILLVSITFAVFSCAEKNPRVEYANQRAQIRAYEGAPPVIPHSILKSAKLNCLACHLKGAVYEPDSEILGKKNAVAKITPHPTWENCLQCHVVQENAPLFHKNNFKTYHLAYTMKTTAMEGENPPPGMPHQMQNRENCRVCHLSKTANNVIVPKHKITGECEVCHQLPESMDIYSQDEE